MIQQGKANFLTLRDYKDYCKQIELYKDNKNSCIDKWIPLKKSFILCSTYDKKQLYYLLNSYKLVNDKKSQFQSKNLSQETKNFIWNSKTCDEYVIPSLDCFCDSYDGKDSCVCFSEKLNDSLTKHPSFNNVKKICVCDDIYRFTCLPSSLKKENGIREVMNCTMISGFEKFEFENQIDCKNYNIYNNRIKLLISDIRNYYKENAMETRVSILTFVFFLVFYVLLRYCAVRNKYKCARKSRKLLRKLKKAIKKKYKSYC